MTFNEIVNILFSNDRIEICKLLQSARHITYFNYKNLKAIHTGFYCKIQTGTIFEFIYHFSEEILFFQKKKSIIYVPIGTPVSYSETAFIVGFNTSSISYELWNDSYNVSDNIFNAVKLIGKDISNRRILSFVSENSNNINSFSIIYKDRIEKYPLYVKEIPFFYYVYNFYLDEKKYNDNARRFKDHRLMDENH